MRRAAKNKGRVGRHPSSPPTGSASTLSANVNNGAHNTSWRGTLRLLGAWTLLDQHCNVRFPGLEPPLWYLLPSLDATALLARAGFFAARGWDFSKSERGTDSKRRDSQT
jgi:hypothetical protein